MTTDHRLPVADQCRHKSYRLTCDEFEQRLELCDRRCEVCGKRIGVGSYRLNIDHDHAIGRWAVRGLLCQGCNCFEVPLRAPTPAVLSYLANPWWHSLLSVNSVTRDGPPEPGLEGVIRDRIGGMYWRRTLEGWVRSRRRPCTWHEVVDDIGPHNVRVIRPGLSQAH